MAEPTERLLSGFSLLNTHFVIHTTSSTSLYAISKRKRMGLIVSNLPFGVLINVYRKPVIAQQAVPLVERFCDRLKT